MWLSIFVIVHLLLMILVFFIQVLKRLINDQRARFTLIAWLSSTAHVNLTFLKDRRFSKDEQAAVTLCKYFLLILVQHYLHSN